MAEILRVDNVFKHYSQSQGLFKRVEKTVLRDVSLHILEGESLGLVGESGSGKTTLARCIMGILKPDAGTVSFNGADIALLKGDAQHEVRRQLSIVYQNPYLSLNPHFTLLELIAEPIKAHEKVSSVDLLTRVQGLLEQVGLDPDFYSKKIGALSGGQAQRVAIARALSLKPKLVILDEPTSALDVSVQAQILNLLTSLQQDTQCSYLFITHNLDVVRHTCDRVLVMSEGQIVEQGESSQVLSNPQHTFTQKLIAATPRLKGGG